MLLLAASALFGAMVVGASVGLAETGGSVLTAVIIVFDLVGVAWGAIYIARQARLLRRGTRSVKGSRRPRRGVSFAASALALAARGTALIGIVVIVGVPFLFGGAVAFLFCSFAKYAIGEPSARLAAGLELGTSRMLINVGWTPGRTATFAALQPEPVASVSVYPPHSGEQRRGLPRLQLTRFSRWSQAA